MAELRLSSAGKCARALAFDLAGFPRPAFTPEAERRMELGHAFEALVIARLVTDGYEVTRQQSLVGLEGVPGHIDGLIAGPSMPLRLLEIKSMGASSWRDWTANGIQRARAPYLRAYYSQVQAYMEGLRSDGLEVNACHFVVAFRDDDSADPTATDFEVQTELVHYDALEVSRVRDRLRRAQAGGHGEALREYTLDESGFLAPACKWCDHRELCWGALQVVKVGRSERLMPMAAMEF